MILLQRPWSWRLDPLRMAAAEAALDQRFQGRAGWSTTDMVTGIMKSLVLIRCLVIMVEGILEYVEGQLHLYILCWCRLGLE
jgi:hypothetical protein